MTDSEDLPEELADHMQSSPVSHRVYDTMLGIRQPAPIEDIADLALCEPSEAQDVIDTLDEMRVVQSVSKNGETRYYRNEKFIQWMRAMMLAEEHARDELDELSEEADNEALRFESLYGVSSPDDLMLPIDNHNLQDRMKKDATHWRLIEQTQNDIEIAKLLIDSDETEEE